MTDPGGSLLSVRRYYLSVWRSSALEGLRGVSAVFLGLHAAQPGTPLPTSTPGYDRLVAANYTAVEDVVGASVDELIRCARLSRPDAEAALLSVS